MPIGCNVTKKDGTKVYVEVQDDSRQRCEIWSRVMGYLAVRDQYNIGKKQEFADRKFFSEPTKLPDAQPSLPGTE